jgi:hypothetical protein
LRARAGAVLVLLLAPFAFASDRLAIADSDGKAIAILDVASGKIVSSVALPDPPSQVLATADGKRLVAISRGPGKFSWLGQFRPTGKASATVIDTESMNVLGRIELGWDAADAQITSDGRRLMVLSPGVDMEGADGRLGSVHVIDLVKGAVAGSINLERPAQGALLSGDQKQVVIYSQGAPRAKRPTLLRFLDLEKMDAPPSDVLIAAKTLPPAAFEGHDLIYLLDPPATRGGTLHIVSASQHKLLASHTVGRNASLGAFDEDSGRLFVLSQATGEGQRGGRLDVFKDGQLLGATKPVVNQPHRMTFTPDRKQAIIGGNDTLIMPLDGPGPESVLGAGAAYEVHFTPDMKRAFFFYWNENACCSVAVVDLPKRETMKTYLIGSKGARLGQALVAGLLGAASYMSSAGLARSTGSSSFYYTVYMPRVASAGRGMMVVRPDGIAYALDPQTDYVTRIDAESGERLEGIKVGGGSRQLVPLQDNAVISVVAARTVTFIDTATQQKSGVLTFAGELRGVETNSGGTRGIALGDRRVVVFDAAGKTVAEVTTLEKPVGWVFF